MNGVDTDFTVYADEFSLDCDTLWVYLYDGEGTERVMMPREVWDDLVNTYTEIRES